MASDLASQLLFPCKYPREVRLRVEMLGKAMGDLASHPRHHVSLVSAETRSLRQARCTPLFDQGHHCSPGTGVIRLRSSPSRKVGQSLPCIML